MKLRGAMRSTGATAVVDICRACDPWVVPNLLLYDYSFSGNGWKVRTLLRCLGRPFTIRWVDILRGEQHKPWFRSKNAVGQIPVVEDEAGCTWTESNAIL